MDRHPVTTRVFAAAGVVVSLITIMFCLWRERKPQGVVAWLRSRGRQGGFRVLCCVHVYDAVHAPPHDAAPPWLLNVLALALLALTARPLWRWAQLRVHDLIFGVDDTNIAVIGQISEAFASTALDATQLVALAETIVQIMRLPYAKIEIWNGVAAAAGAPYTGGVLNRVELTARESVVGQLEVMARLPGQPLTAGEQQLLHSLARQVSIMLHVAQLSDALLVF